MIPPVGVRYIVPLPEESSILFVQPEISVHRFSSTGRHGTPQPIFGYTQKSSKIMT